MSCNSCSNITLPQGATGAQGASGTNGTDGSNGIFGGFSMEFDFDSSIVNTPPAGEIRFNNATLSSVTEIFVSTTGTGSANAAPFLDSFDDNGDPGNYGLIRVFKQHDSPVFWLGRVTAIATSGASRTLTVQYITSGSDPFSDGDDTIVSFVSNGADGVNGATKSGAIYNYSILDDGDNKTGTSFQLMNTFSIPANTFETNMDEISLKGGFSGWNTPNAEPGGYVFKVQIDGQDIIDTQYAYNLGTFVSPYDIPGVSFEMKLYRTASNKLRPVILYKNIYKFQLEENNILISDSWAGNLVSSEGGMYFFSFANVSLPEITCPTAFTSALTVNIYMRSTTSSVSGERPDAPAFRVMNLHSSYNKI